MQFKENDECTTVSYGLVRGSAKKWKYWQAAKYKATRLKNGKLVWKYVEHFGTARRSYRLAEKEAKSNCKLYLEDIRNNVEVK